MKILDSSFSAALSAEVRTVTRCARLVRTDGEVFGLTEFDRDLTFAGTTYRSIHGLSPTAFQADLNFQANNIQFSGLLSEDGITEADLRIGLFDYARIEVFIVNYLDLPADLSANPPRHLILPVRSLGKVSYSEGDYTAEIMGLSRFLEGKISNSTSKTCRNDLGDSRCTVNVEAFAETLTVNNALEPLSFFATVAPPVDRYTGGKIIFLSGGNDGLTVPILKQSGTQFFLPAALPVPLVGGENFRAFPNCQKRLEDCRLFNNQPNFGAEDDLPGLDAYIGQEA
ncbi:DUF2163 domain-containing protein [Pannus brasiliensis CCIBt3594]|uniref:DUF2163 domain-containing protein n=1 Tax=Pannus brasiliensis CCIBt3594 TaxID=1427578 RepID=A0AAW9QW54_9CHRO